MGSELASVQEIFTHSERKHKYFPEEEMRMGGRELFELHEANEDPYEPPVMTKRDALSGKAKRSRKAKKAKKAKKVKDSARASSARAKKAKNSARAKKAKHSARARGRRPFASFVWRSCRNIW